MDETTTINLEKKPTSAEKKKQPRETLRGVERKLEHPFEQRDFDLVMQNRLSLNKYNQIRLATSFETTDDTRQRVFRQGVKVRRHGKREENLNIDETTLLEEASTWDSNTKVNWTELATKHGLTSSNRGQIIKEFLASKNIPLAQTTAPPRVRRSKMQLGAGISQPQHPTVSALKVTLANKIERMAH